MYFFGLELTYVVMPDGTVDVNSDWSLVNFASLELFGFCRSFSLYEAAFYCGNGLICSLFVILMFYSP